MACYLNFEGFRGVGSCTQGVELCLQRCRYCYLEVPGRTGETITQVVERRLQGCPVFYYLDVPGRTGDTTTQGDGRGIKELRLFLLPGAGRTSEII